MIFDVFLTKFMQILYFFLMFFSLLFINFL